MQALRALRLPWSAWSKMVLVWAFLSSTVAICAWIEVSRDFAPAPFLRLLDWQPDRWPTQPWRAWTAGLVHWSVAHLGLNILACAVLIAWGHAAALGRPQTLSWFLAWPLTHALLSLVPSLAHYGGLSGVLHAGVSIGAWTLIRQGVGPRRWVGAIVFIGLLLKLALELPDWNPWLTFESGLPMSAPQLNQPLQGAPGYWVASVAHLSGAVSGLVCSWLIEVVQCLRRR